MDSANTSQAKILVKKADGTSVRMTLDEFKKYKQGFGTKNNKANKPETEENFTTKDKIKQDNIKVEKKEKETVPVVDEPKLKKFEPKIEKESDTNVMEDSDVFLGREDEGEEAFIEDNVQVKKVDNMAVEEKHLRVEEPHYLATTTPVKDIFIDEAAASLKWGKDDHKSPLEEKFEEKIEPIVPVLPDKKEDNVSLVIKKLSFFVPNKILSKLRSLILSRIKNIRTDDQIKNYAGRAEKEGGLGLSIENVDELVKAIHDVIINLPEKRLNKVSMDKVVEKKVEKPIQNLSEKKPWVQSANAVESNKKILHDIKVSDKPKNDPVEEDKIVGPVDEFKLMTLVDFRRLSSKPEESVENLKERFNILKQESYILYLKAVNAWQQSELYKNYQGVIKEAIEQNKKVKDLLSSAEGSLNYNEFEAIARLNININV